jgi:hypothetical protein
VTRAARERAPRQGYHERHALAQGTLGRVAADSLVWLLPAAIFLYSVVAVLQHWWLSGIVAVLAATLMWRRHPRARFTAYILLSAVALRGAFTASWRALGFALVVLALMQTPAARRAWPRLTLGARPGGPSRSEPPSEDQSGHRGDRMAAP